MYVIADTKGRATRNTNIFISSTNNGDNTINIVSITSATTTTTTLLLLRPEPGPAAPGAPCPAIPCHPVFTYYDHPVQRFAIGAELKWNILVRAVVWEERKDTALHIQAEGRG